MRTSAAENAQGFTEPMASGVNTTRPPIPAVAIRSSHRIGAALRPPPDCIAGKAPRFAPANLLIAIRVLQKVRGHPAVSNPPEWSGLRTFGRIATEFSRSNLDTLLRIKLACIR